MAANVKVKWNGERKVKEMLNEVAEVGRGLAPKIVRLIRARTPSGATGGAKRAVTWDQVKTPTNVHTIIGIRRTSKSNAYWKRLEFGFFGTDSLGRNYKSTQGIGAFRKSLKLSRKRALKAFKKIRV